MEKLQALDAELARRAREAGRLRFEIGRGLEQLERGGGHHALGFSSIEAYALERCERSASWTQKARGLARKLSQLRAITFLRFACELFLRTWRPPVSDAAYARIYERDLHRCQSPCCGRRDVTPHHLRFRSRGGDDSDENVTSLCAWCHLEGIHQGQMSATPPAPRIRWTFGRTVHTVVEGRRRMRT